MLIKATGKRDETKLIDLERSLVQAKGWPCGASIIRSILLCIRKKHGELEEHRIIQEHRLSEILATE
jgi:hypothetical protein